MRRHLAAVAIAVTAAFPGLLAVSGSAPAAAVVTAPGTVAPAAVSGGTWEYAMKVPGLAALNTSYEETTSVSCATVGNCVVGGYYTDGSYTYEQVFVAEESGGIWHNAIEVPGLAALNTGNRAQVTSVSCATAGNCVVSGGYTRSQDQSRQVFVAEETGGAWHNAIEVPGLAALNTGGDAIVTSVSCGAAGDCAADGNYEDSNGNYQGYVAEETGGTWHNAIEVPGLAALNSSGYADVTSVSCGAAGYCAVGGNYSTNIEKPFVADETGGTWHKAIEIPGTAALNPGGVSRGNVTSVSCATAGYCLATGFTGWQPFVDSMQAGGTGRIRGYKYQCASDYRYRQAPGTPVVIHVCNTMLREKWTIGVGHTLISHGLCLTDPGWGRWRTRQVLQPCTGWSDQRWTHKANGEYVSAVHGLCLTDPRWSTTAGTQLILQSCRDWKNQRWTKP